MDIVCELFGDRNFFKHGSLIPEAKKDMHLKYNQLQKKHLGEV